VAQARGREHQEAGREGEAVTLTDEQRAGLARFLGFKEVAVVSKRFAPCHPYLIDADGTLEGERQWNDADLMLALLERAAEQNYYVRIGPNHAPDYPGDFILRDWSASICELPFDLEREVTFYGATPLEAMVEAVLQLPEAQP
jgi:hypothetical protein